MSDPAAELAPAEAQRTSYWAVVAAQLRKNRVAMVAWALVRGLLFVAVAAPVLAFNVPLVHVGEHGPRLPLVSALFDRSLFESGVDVFFNLLLVALPVWLLARRVGRGRARAARGEGRAPWASTALLALVLLLEALALVGARRSFAVAVLVAAVPGGVLSLLGASGRVAVRRARLGCLAALVLALVLLFALPAETSPSRVWRGPQATESGWMLFPPVPYHPNDVGDPTAIERARKHPDGANWLGCDLNGRDVLTRIFFGTRISVTIGLVGVSIYVLIGIVLGSLAGYYGGRTDLVIMRLVEIMICFPTLFLILTIIAVFGRSIFLIMAAIGFVGWPGVARLVRAEFLRQRSLDYVTAALAQGIPERRVIFRHVLPNCLGPVLVSATFGIAGAILTESGLAFLGLGDQMAVSWGEMLTTGRSSQEWHLILVPGMAIFFVVLVFNLLGEGLRDALDPKLRR